MLGIIGAMEDEVSLIHGAMEAPVLTKIGEFE
jgi:hypothetical protein